MRIMDVFLMFPALLLAIAVVSVLGNEPVQRAARDRRRGHPGLCADHAASVLTVREQDFVTASRALGERPAGAILLRRVHAQLR